MPLRSQVGLAVGAVALVVLVLTLMRRDARDAPAPVAPSLPAYESATAEPEGAQAIESERARVVDRDVEVDVAAVAPTARTESERSRIWGRCVAAESGRPLAGVGIELSLSVGRDRRPACEPRVTAGDGRFEFAFDVGSGERLHLAIDAPGRTPRAARWREFGRSTAIDLGDVPCELGFFVEGQVIEVGGTPVEGAGITLSGMVVGLDAGDGVPAALSGRSDALGAFRIAGAVPAGEWPLMLDQAGLRLVSPERVHVDALVGIEPLTVLVARKASIAGRVVDSAGVGVGGVRLQIEPRGGASLATDRTRADGAFELFAPDEHPAPRRVIVQDPGPCEAPDDAGPPYAWGTQDALIVLRRALTLDLQVVERESGSPVTEFAVACFRTDATSSLPQRSRLAGTHPEGRVVVDRVLRGRNRLQVRPASDDLLPSDWILFDAGDGMAPLRVELERMRPARVRVLASDGDPVAGSRAALFRRTPNSPHSGSGYLFVSEPGEEHMQDSAGILPEVAAATTDDRGEVVLRFPEELELCVLRVTGADHIEFRQERPALSADAVHEVVVARGARVEGRCVVRGYEGQQVALQFARDGEWMTSEGLAPLGPDGAFRSPPLTPGAIAIHLTTLPGNGFGMRAPLEPPVQRVELGEGEVLRLDLDARAWDAASVTGQVLLDGSAPASGQLYLRLLLPNLHLSYGPYPVDGDGAFEALGLPPGRWKPSLVLAEPDPLDSPEAFDLAGGARLELELRYTLRRRVLRLLGADGKTVLAGRSILVFRANGEGSFATADAQGRARIDSKLQGEVEFMLEGRPEMYRVVLPEPGDENALDVVLSVEP